MTNGIPERRFSSGAAIQYDGVYVALAELLEAPLVTCDRRLARAKGHDAVVEVFA